MSTLINRIRFHYYISGVLANQQTDPLCGTCKAYANTLSALKEDLARLGNEHADERASLSEEVLCIYEEARNRIAAMHAPENASGQKKAGYCKMPEGVCFIKSSKAMWDRIEGERPKKTLID